MLPQSTLTLCSLYTPEIASYAEPVAILKERYCRQWGYRWQCEKQTLDHTRHPSWSKIICCLKAFGQGADWVFWTDADALIQRFDFPAYDLLGNYDFGCSEGLNGNFTNMGCFLIRRCEAAYQFLSDIYHCDPYLWTCPIWEQSRANQLLFNSNHKMRVKVFPRKAFNTYLTEYTNREYILHFAGINNREEIIPKFLGENRANTRPYVPETHR